MLQALYQWEYGISYTLLVDSAVHTFPFKGTTHNVYNFWRYRRPDNLPLALIGTYSVVRYSYSHG